MDYFIITHILTIRGYLSNSIFICVVALAQSFSAGGMFLLLGITTMMGFLIAYDKIKFTDNLNIKK